jgi:hypothetical protein
MVREVTPKPPTDPEHSAVHPYSVTDPIPVPKAVESDTDTTWALWADSLSPDSGKSGTAFDKTIPAALLPSTPVMPISIDRRKEVKFDRRKSDHDRRGDRKPSKG